MTSAQPPPPPPDLTTLPTLLHLATLPCPTSTTSAGRGSGPASRAWQSTPHPSASAPLLAVASADKSVYIWSLRNFQMVSKIEGGHKRSVRCVEWKDYGEEEQGMGMMGGGSASAKRRKVTLATGSFDANVGVWEHARAGRRRGWSGAANTTTTTRAGQVDEQDGQSMEHDAVTSEAGNGYDDNDAENNDDNNDDDEQDAEEWNFTTLLTGPDSEIKSMHFSPPHYSANLLATSSRDKSVWVWEEVEDEEWETIAVLQEHTGDVKCVRWCEGVSVRVPVTLTGQADGGERDGSTATTKTETETKIIGTRELLASSSYDDTIRLWRDVEEEGDWTCIALLEGHSGTVWDLSWEKWISQSRTQQPDWEVEEFDGPRLLSCSDDLSVRVWRRELSEGEREKRRQQQQRQNHTANGTTGGGGIGMMAQRLPSIIRPTGHFETWIEEARLPEVHVRSVYALDWSRRSGLVVSCGGDGTIAVYREVDVDVGDGDGDVVMTDSTATAEAGAGQGSGEQPQEPGQAADAQGRTTRRRTKWVVVALVEAAHDEYEINHVCWATRRDPEARFPEEEIIVSTGDEGDVKIWTLPDELLARA